MKSFDVYQEIENLLGEYPKSNSTRYDKNLALFLYLIGLNLAYDLKKEAFVFERPSTITTFDRFKNTALSFLQYLFDYEYIIEEVKKLPTKYSQDQIEQVITNNELENTFKKINNQVEYFALNKFLMGDNQKSRWLELDESTKFIDPEALLNSEFITQNNGDYNFSFKHNEHDRLSNAFVRIINCEKQSGEISLFSFSRIKPVHEIYIKGFNMFLNMTNFSILYNGLTQKIKELIALILYYSLLQDIVDKSPKKMIYQPSVYVAKGATDSVNKYASGFIEKLVVDSQKSLIRKLHSTTYDLETNRFKESALKKAIQRKGYSFK